MIRHDVDDQPHAVLAQLCDQSLELFLGAQLGIQARVIGDVVAMRAARPGLEDRRGIDMADAEPLQVRHDARGVGEGEFAIELQPIRRARNVHDDSNSASARPCTA
jgi:hypothetical protein